jgi:hypothetical protein
MPPVLIYVATFTAALLLAAVHILAGKLRFLNVIPRSAWLSAAGGASVAYVFIHVLPDLVEQQRQYVGAIRTHLPYLERHVYLLALAGLVTFYGIERMVKLDRQKNREAAGMDITSPGIFWLHTTFFAAYNFLIGYLLLHREQPGPISLFLFWLAMSLHFVVNDYGLREDDKEQYQRVGRWLLGAVVVMGWAVGALTALHPAMTVILFSFLAGAVILNVLKEELPESRRSRFWTFFAGAAAYALLALLI